MKIEVGSEWVGNTGLKFTVKAIDEDKVFVRYEDGDHRIIAEDPLRKFCKPAPKRRTVVLNVYRESVTSHESKKEADSYMLSDCMFQQVVELIDPRGGENEQ